MGEMADYALEIALEQEMHRDLDGGELEEFVGASSADFRRRAQAERTKTPFIPVPTDIDFGEW